MASGPEMARLIEEFQISAGKTQNIVHHHEQKRHKQLVFARDVKTLRETIKEMGNPFTEESSDLHTNIVDETENSHSLRNKFAIVCLTSA